MKYVSGRVVEYRQNVEMMKYKMKPGQKDVVKIPDKIAKFMFLILDIIMDHKVNYLLYSLWV